MKHAPPGLAHLRDDLAALQRADLLRDDAPRLREGVSFSSNDYLGLAERGVVQGRAGAGASRLVDGDRPDHRALERALGEWLQVEGVLLFTSGYAANVGVLSALVRPGDVVVSDELNHASLIDGIRLSRGVVRIVPHLDLGAVQRILEEPRSGRAWVVTESYFSMDADSPDLRALRGLCDRHGALRQLRAIQGDQESLIHMNLLVEARHSAIRAGLLAPLSGGIARLLEKKRRLCVEI